MATITISFDVTDEMQAHLLTNFNQMVGKSLAVEAEGEIKTFKIEESEDPETNIEFGKRVIKEIVLNMVKANALQEDRQRYNSESAAIDPITENIPDNLLI